MAATSRDVIAFKARIPELRELPDADIAAALDETDMWLDEAMWDVNDYPWARMWLTAHHLKLAQGIGLSGDSSSGANTSTDLFVRMVAFGERRVMFGERKMSRSEGGAIGAGEAMLEDTIYGQKYLRLRSRNIIGIITV